MVLQIYFVEHLPNGKAVVIAGSVQFPVLIRKATPGIPAHNACIVVAQLPPGRVFELGTLRVTPIGLVRVRRILDRLAGLEKPRRNGAEIHDHAVTTGGRQKVFHHRVYQREVPGGGIACGRLQFGNCETRV